MQIRRLASAAAAASVCSVAAAELDLAWDGMAAHESIRYSLDESVSWDSAARDRNRFAFAGMLSFNAGDYLLFCIELEEAVSSDATPYLENPFDTTDVELQNRVRVLSSLFDGYYDEIVATRDDARAAAFAMLTWEIMSEQFSGDGMDLIAEIDFELGAAQFGEYSTAAAAAAEEMRDNLFVADDARNLLRYSSSEYQDFVGPVPAPGAIGLLGLAGLAGRRRRRD